MIFTASLLVCIQAFFCALLGRIRTSTGAYVSLHNRSFSSRYYYAYGLMALRRPYSLIILGSAPRNWPIMPSGVNLLQQLSDKAGTLPFSNHARSNRHDYFARGVDQLAMDDIQPDVEEIPAKKLTKKVVRLPKNKTDDKSQ